MKEVEAGYFPYRAENTVAKPPLGLMIFVPSDFRPRMVKMSPAAALQVKVPTDGTPPLEAEAVKLVPSAAFTLQLGVVEEGVTFTNS